MNDIDLLIELHNEIRAKKTWFKKLHPLSKDKLLVRYAKNHSIWMSKNQKLIHSNIQNILNLGFNTAGENIAWGQPDANSVMKTWMKSVGHRRNILGDNYTKIGGYVEPDEIGKLYWCVVFAA